MPVPGRSVLMTQKKLAAWLRFVIIGFAVVGAGAYFWAIPQFGLSIVGRYPEFAYAFRPWVALIWATAIPCYAALVVAWKVADSLADQFQRIRTLPFYSEERTRNGVQEHFHLIELILQNKKEEAAAFLDKHISNTEHYFFMSVITPTN